MFTVNETTGKITMHRGDTGSLTFTFSGYDWTADDFRAMFSMKKNNQTVKEQITAIPAKPESSMRRTQNLTVRLKCRFARRAGFPG